MPYLLELKS